MVYPNRLGHGTRLFDEDAPVKLALARSEAYDNGVVYLSYSPER